MRKIDVSRIRNSRGYNEDTLRLDMAERGCVHFPQEIYDSWKESLTQLDVMAYPDYSTYVELEDVARNQFFPGTNTKVVFDCGSDALIKLIIESCVDVSEHVICPSPSFPMYSIYAKAMGRNVLEVGHRGAELKISLRYIADQIVEGRISGGVVFLSNPTSPYGELYSDADISTFVEFLAERNIILVLDQAYREFAAVDNDVEIGVYENLLRLRTLSKAGGLAGLRIGFAAGPAAIIDQIRKCQLTFPISNPAVKFALALMKQWGEVSRYAELVRTERNIIVTELASRQFSVVNSHTNSIHFRKDELAEFIKNSSESCITNVLLKYGSNIGTPVIIPGSDKVDWVRMSIVPSLSKSEFFAHLIRA